jgi:hypothetical protein
VSETSRSQLLPISSFSIVDTHRSAGAPTVTVVPSTTFRRNEVLHSSTPTSRRTSPTSVWRVRFPTTSACLAAGYLTFTYSPILRRTPPRFERFSTARKLRLCVKFTFVNFASCAYRGIHFTFATRIARQAAGRLLLAQARGIITAVRRWTTIDSNNNDNAIVNDEAPSRSRNHQHHPHSATTTEQPPLCCVTF